MTDTSSIPDLIRRTGLDVDADRWRLIHEGAVLHADTDGTRVIVTYELGLGPHAHRWMDESRYGDRGERREVCTACGEERVVRAAIDTPDE